MALTWYNRNVKSLRDFCFCFLSKLCLGISPPMGRHLIYLLMTSNCTLLMTVTFTSVNSSLVYDALPEHDLEEFGCGSSE